MFPVGRIYRTATKEDMLKLASKFGAETTEADELKLLSFHSQSFEQQKMKSETIALNRTCEAAKRSMDLIHLAKCGVQGATQGWVRLKKKRRN